MGRHSTSYIAARQGRPTGSASLGAARYVGRVGALAVAMGVGAAAFGGVGVAAADDASHQGGTQAPPTSPSGENATTGTVADAPAGGSAGATTAPTPSVPKMMVTGGVATGRRVGGDDQDSLPGMLARIPHQIAAALSGGFAKTDSPRVTGSGSRGGGRSSSDQRPGSPTTAGDDAAASSVTSTVTDDAAATPRTMSPLSVQPSASPDAAPVRRLLTTPAIVAVPSTVAAQPAAIPAPSTPRLINPIVTVVSGVLNALGFSPSVTTGGSPTAPMPIVLAALQLLRREIDHFVTNVTSAAAYYNSAQVHAVPSTAVGVPSPTDEAPTAYGDIGKWMLEPGGDISDYGGQPYGGRTLLEPVNVIIVDPTSSDGVEAARKLNTAMFWAGFPAQPIHSTGFTGRIDDMVYGQQPTGLLQGFSDNLFIFPNDHGRIFGPDPVQTSKGFVWSGAFSTEQLGVYDFLPTHTYVSSDLARTALATRLILSGQATYVGMVPLNNAVDDPTTTTGDHDGYAVVLRLR